MGNSLEYYQKSVLLRALPLSEKVVEAFYAHPRHLFVPEYTLEDAYADHPLVLYNKHPFTSTISQPSFVLRILDWLKLTEGQTVFELGTGSGWNTAMMASVVGPSGRIVTVEVIPELAERAAEILQRRGLNNVIVRAGDGFEGAPDLAPFDRVIFTAGSQEFPMRVFMQLKEEGWMVFVRKTPGTHDTLELIHKLHGQPRVVTSVPCAFVSVVRQKGGLDSKDSHP